MGAMTVVVTLQAILIVLLVWRLLGLRGELDTSESSRDNVVDMWTAERKANRELREECSRLVGELSKAQNTLARRVSPEELQDREPIKAKSAAEIRKAVEKHNQEEIEANG